MILFSKTINLLARTGRKINVLFIPSRHNNYTPTFLKSNVLLYVVVAVLMVKILSIGLFLPFPKNIFFADITKTDLVNLLNQSRKNAGVTPLSQNEKLDQAAMLKAQDMVKNNYFAHQSPQGVTPWFWLKKAEYDYKYAGENLAVGFIESTEVFNAWFNSPGHKANLLSPYYTEVGTAVLTGFGDNNSIIVVQNFGSLPTPKPAPQKSAVPPVATKVVTETPPATAPKAQEPEVIAADTPKPAPTETEVAQVPVAENVLGSSTRISQAKNVDNAKANNAYYRFVNFIVYDYQTLIKYTLQALLIAITTALLINIFINFRIQRQQLIFRSLVLLGILVIGLAINTGLVSYIIPHQILI